MNSTDQGKESPFLRIRALHKNFGSFSALRDVSLDVAEGEFVCFLGPSGCGKTTLLRAIAGLDIQSSGTIAQADRDISALPPSERDFGIVFQSYALFPNLTVERNVAYGLESARRAREAVRTRVDELLELVGLPDQGSKYPSQLSGGQQQRVALARAIATSPGLLLLDEPLSALDAKVRAHLRHEVRALQDRLGITTIMVTHDQEEALTMADRIVVMNHGVIEQVGTPMEVYREPSTVFVADFIGTMNFLRGEAVGGSEVRHGDIRLRCDADGLAAGAAVLVAVRPEDVVVHADTSQAENSFVARVDFLEFLGSFVRADLVASGAGKGRLRADVPIAAVRGMELREGDEVTISLPAENIRVFPDEGDDV